ncbi:hypothetical protein D9615_006581 [Tricholomella constricta]|uniref:4-hydroxybenzoate polyprenyltransferase, mitochondrial n=1 Tax=Tricholomella constricta TaxID=117010 RepID=A0A8H5M2Z1_9AGAR|nr:hypothetical protein D9615_006581 [Tricholomella constricta]
MVCFMDIINTSTAFQILHHLPLPAALLKMPSYRAQSSAPPLKSLAATIKPWIQITRVSKFAGSMVLFWPWAWSVTMAARVLRLEIPAFISLLILGAGCIWNDILDREFDRQVERTKNRPIAAGTISVPGALVFLFIHIAILVRMVWNLDELAFRFGIASIVALPGIYPLMKRITYWPQAWLGIAMNTGAPMAWLALGQGLPTSIMILFAGTWAWTMWYDTIYACQDKRDDVKAGVKSTALLFGTWIKPILFGFASALVASLYVAGVMNNMGTYYHVISVGGGALYLARDMYTIDLDSPKACWDSFHRNGFHFGGLVWAGVLADYLTSL